MVKKQKSAGRPVRLKVFGTHIGLKDWVVAAPNRKEALAAWDVKADLFSSGAAWEVHDPEAVTLALRNPGKPMALSPRRPKGKTSGATVVKFTPRKRK